MNEWVEAGSAWEKWRKMAHLTLLWYTQKDPMPVPMIHLQKVIDITGMSLFLHKP